MRGFMLHYAVAIWLMLGMAGNALSAQEENHTIPQTGVILLAQAGSNIPRTVTRDEAIAKASKIKQGNVIRATLEKRDDQIVWEVMLNDSNRTFAVYIDPKSGDVIKTIQADK